MQLQDRVRCNSIGMKFFVDSMRIPETYPWLSIPGSSGTQAQNGNFEEVNQGSQALANTYPGVAQEPR